MRLVKPERERRGSTARSSVAGDDGVGTVLSPSLAAISGAFAGGAWGLFPLAGALDTDCIQGLSGSRRKTAVLILRGIIVLLAAEPYTDTGSFVSRRTG